MSKYITYNGIPTKCNVDKTLELQRLILDPGYTASINPLLRAEQRKLITRSAVKQIEKKISIEQALELQKKIVPG